MEGSDISEDELAAVSEAEFPLERASKRRRLNRRPVISSSPDSASDHTHSDISTPVRSHGSMQGSQEPGVLETPQEKPKSKYRIHIPKNGDLPKDSFYTQPPQRSSSPYRIEPFCWQKPTVAASGPTDKGAHSTRQSPPIQRHDQILNSAATGADMSAQSMRPFNGSPQCEQEPTSAEDYDDILADLPSDAFSSLEKHSTGVRNHTLDELNISPSRHSASQAAQYLRAPQANMRQTTLFGQAPLGITSQCQPTRRHNWPLANREEPPTHHELEHEALKTWIYPTNLGSIRDYQYSIAAKGLYHNLLVALPTGLGKTFIAATVMLNWFRWTTNAQIIFVAPTRPLVSQQVKACFEIAGIPRAATTMLTGNTQPGIRAEEWLAKRVFFMTPQTLINDLKSGMCDPKKTILLVVDEAHRATGNYAYVEVVKFLKRFNTSFRVLALTATPGASIETVQEVIDGLGISRIEIRTEESLDIRQYVHSRNIDTLIFDNTDEMTMVMDLFSKALQPILDKLNGMNAYWNKDPMALTPYGCNQARSNWMQSDAGRKANFGLKGMVNTIFTLLASLSHGTELLKYHGIGPFFQKVLAFQDETRASGDKGSKYKRQIIESEHFQKMITRVQSWVNNPDFVGHPKLEYLQSVVMNHFLDAGAGRGATDPSQTRIMVFAHFRDSAEEIARVLSRHDLIRPHVFVGQANSKNSEGMDQATQLAVIKKFQDGIYNTLVATSIGEEGLDIGQVDLIVCYDASASPIRMLQRMGRTGRKRAGNIVVTLMRGKEENNFAKAKDNYEKMQREIAAGTKFTFHDDSSYRILPRAIQPVVDKRVIDIPPENTQPDLPEPKRRAKAPKRPAKKFQMPDNVRTGFVRASRIEGSSGNESESDAAELLRARSEVLLESVPALQEVELTSIAQKELEHSYLDVKGDTPQIVVVPRVDAFPTLQRTSRPVQSIRHGQFTKRIVSMLSRMHGLQSKDGEEYERNLSPADRRAGIAQAEKRAAFFKNPLWIGSQQPESGSHPARQGDQARMTEAVGLNSTTVNSISSRELASEEEDPSPTLNERSDVDENNILRVATSTFSPPALANSRNLFYNSQERSRDQAMDSGDDLPEFGALVSKPQVVTRALMENGKAKGTGKGRLKSRRRVIEDDSDEE